MAGAMTARRSWYSPIDSSGDLEDAASHPRTSGHRLINDADDSGHQDRASRRGEAA